MKTQPGTIAQVCHEANRAYSATQGDRTIPAWGGLNEDAQAGIRNRVTADLERLGKGLILMAGAETGPPGADSYGDPIRDSIFNGIVLAFFETGTEAAVAPSTSCRPRHALACKTRSPPEL
jgi:hypothetical protein